MSWMRPTLAGWGISSLLVASAGPILWTESAPETSPAEETGCLVYADGISNPNSIISLFALPGESVDLTMAGPCQSEFHTVEVSGGDLDDQGDYWTWTAPSATGLYTGELRRAGASEPVKLNLFVTVPRTNLNNGVLNGYVIGEYPEPMPGREALYQSPSGFVEVTEDNENVFLSPHFSLKQFLCKQESGYPKYVILEERLLVALEALVGSVQEHGYDVSTLVVMSGYRTPVYNRSIGNVVNSRHVFGDAADIFIDHSPADGVMDDLNGDGRIDIADAEVLAAMVDRTLADAQAELGEEDSTFVGGMGEYAANAVHGPFVHIDFRGYRARW